MVLIGGKQMRDIDRAVELLKPLFTGLAEGRNEIVDIYADVYNGEDYITKNVISNITTIDLSNRNMYSLNGIEIFTQMLYLQDILLPHML